MLDRTHVWSGQDGLLCMLTDGILAASGLIGRQMLSLLLFHKHCSYGGLSVADERGD